MWCRNCHQDVPAVAAAGEPSHVCCARCANVLDVGGEDCAGAAAVGQCFDQSDRLSPQVLDVDWDLDKELREARQLVQRIRLHAEPAGECSAEATCDPYCDPTKQASLHTAIGRAMGAIAGSLTGLGLAGLACGCALLIGSIVARRPELWMAGLPASLIGQVALVCGVLLRRDNAERRIAGQQTLPANASFAPMRFSSGAQPTGWSVHSRRVVDDSGALDTQRLAREIEVVMRRSRAA